MTKPLGRRVSPWQPPNQALPLKCPCFCLIDPGVRIHWDLHIATLVRFHISGYFSFVW